MFSSHSPVNLSFHLHKIIHLSNSFKKERVDGLCFFMLLIKSFSGGNFLDGISAGHLYLGQAWRHCYGKGEFSQSATASEVYFSGSLLFNKECSCCSFAFFSLPLCHWINRDFSMLLLGDRL